MPDLLPDIGIIYFGIGQNLFVEFELLNQPFQHPEGPKKRPQRGAIALRPLLIQTPDR